MTPREPAPRPCESCPYRRDVPSGVWAPEEYAKLLLYDLETSHQPIGLFMCHQGNERVCGGWAACHGAQAAEDRRHELLSLRMAGHLFGIPWKTMVKIRNYVSPVPLFSSGREAAKHGLKDLENPSDEAIGLQWKIEDNLDRRKDR